jgi:hypothetical protein
VLSQVLWAEILLAAALIQYTVVNDWIKQVARGVIPKAVAVTVLVLLLASLRWPSLVLAVWIAGILTLLDFFQDTADHRKVSAELHLAGALLLSVGTGWIIRAGGLQPRLGPIVVPFTPNRLAALGLVAALVVFAVRGGTLIVRGVLRKAGTLPTLVSSVGDQQIDTAEYNRGRLIGELERLLLIASVAVGAYAAMAFIIAAKGLIRIKEFEDRNFAEYFLVGTLTSALIAFLVGLLVRATIQTYW